MRTTMTAPRLTASMRAVLTADTITPTSSLFRTQNIAAAHKLEAMGLIDIRGDGWDKGNGNKYLDYLILDGAGESLRTELKGK